MLFKSPFTIITIHCTLLSRSPSETHHFGAVRQDLTRPLPDLHSHRDTSTVPSPVQYFHRILSRIFPSAVGLSAVFPQNFSFEHNLFLELSTDWIWRLPPREWPQPNSLGQFPSHNHRISAKFLRDFCGNSARICADPFHSGMES